MKLKDTRIKQGGAFRCDFSAFEGLDEDQDFQPGDTLKCKYCEQIWKLGQDGFWRTSEEE